MMANLGNTIIFHASSIDTVVQVHCEDMVVADNI